MMIPITLDTRENKTPQIIDQWITTHPRIAGEIAFSHDALENGDMEGNGVLHEFKWGSDAKGSLNSKHLEDQLQRMHQSGKQPHLIIADLDELPILKRAMSLCQQYGVWFHHRATKLEAVDCAIQLIRKPIRQIPLLAPIVRAGGKAIGLIHGLSESVDGLSVEFAETLIDPTWTTWKEVVDNCTATYIVAKAHAFYKKDMLELIDKLLRRIG